jgi:tripartite-type tricarboxylate transporter receptor subunit TctC
MVLINQETGIELVHVPYRGTAAVLPNVLGGQIDAIIGDVSVIAPNVKSGALVALAVTAPERSPLLPDVPTMAQSVGIHMA